MNAHGQPAAPRPPDDRLPAPAELAAWLELAGVDGELERMLARLVAVRAGLALPAVGSGRAVPAAEVDTILGCLVEHLRPAREAVQRFEGHFFLGERTKGIAAWAAPEGLRELQTAGHERFRNFLAKARGDALPALRHLLGCFLCQQLARIVLFGFLPGPAPGRARRRRRTRRRRARLPGDRG